MGLLIALMLGQAGLAEPEPDCANSVVQSDLNYCAAQDFHRADAALNAQWRITAAEMRRRDTEVTASDRQIRREDWPGYFETLLAAQRAWRTYRDNHCDNEGYLYWGGSMEPLIVAGCRTALTEERTEQLRQLAEWP